MNFSAFFFYSSLSLSRAPFSWATHDDVAERERAKVSSSAKDMMLYNPARCLCGWGEANSRSSSRISPRETIENKTFFLRILNRERGVCISRNDNIKLHNDTLQVGRSHSLSHRRTYPRVMLPDMPMTATAALRVCERDIPTTEGRKKKKEANIKIEKHDEKLCEKLYNI